MGNGTRNASAGTAVDQDYRYVQGHGSDKLGGAIGWFSDHDQPKSDAIAAKRASEATAFGGVGAA